MSKHIFEVVKEYVLRHDDLDFSVKGQITKMASNDGTDIYYWSISHHYRPSESAIGVYYPSRVSAATFDEAEQLLHQYMSGFTAIDVTPNSRY